MFEVLRRGMRPILFFLIGFALGVLGGQFSLSHQCPPVKTYEQPGSWHETQDGEWIFLIDTRRVTWTRSWGGGE